MFGSRSYQSSSHWYEVTIWMQEPRGTINKKCGAYSGQRAGHWLAAGAHPSLHQSPVLLETSVVESSPVIWYNAVTCIFHVKSNMMHWHRVESQFNKSCIPDDNIKNMKQRWTSVLLTWSNIVIWHKSVVTLSLFHYSYNFWGHFDQLCLWCWFWYWMITLILQNYLHCW